MKSVTFYLVGTGDHSQEFNLERDLGVDMDFWNALSKEEKEDFLMDELSEWAHGYIDYYFEENDYD